ncbi:MAG: hypothetical protein JXQ80_00885 [Bacteroidales bacterium]|nr:hypothetical protein [Bacteroidales bacterium]
MKIMVRLIVMAIMLANGLAFRAAAQHIEVIAGERDILSSITTRHKIIGHDQEHFYVIKYVGSRYFIEKTDKNLNKELEVPVKLYKGLKTYEFEHMVHFHNELLLFVSYRAFSHITLYYQKLDKATLQPLDEFTELTMVDFVKGNWADFHFALSRQETKLLIACRTKLAWSGAQFNEYYVYGEGFNLDWKRKDSFKFQGQGPRDNKYVVDDAGNVTILSLIKRESIFSLWSDVKNMYALYRYTQQGEMFREYPVALPELFIRGIKITGTEKGELICAGHYSEVLKAGIRGTFFFTLNDANGETPRVILSKFEDAFLDELAALKDPVMKEEELMSYVVSELVYRPNGRIIMVAEQVFNQTYNTYNNLIVTCFEPNGQVYWSRVIPKKQNFAYPVQMSQEIELPEYRSFVKETGFMYPGLSSLSSFAMMAPVYQNRIIVLFNDDIRNPGSDKQRAFGQPRKSYLKAVEIDEYGNLTTHQLVSWKKKALFPEPIRYYDTLGETIVIPAFRNRLLNFYKITAGVSP